MKKTWIFKIIAVMIISLALILTGCGGRGKAGEEPVKPQNQIEEEKQAEENKQDGEIEEDKEEEKGDLDLKEDTNEEKDIADKEPVEEGKKAKGKEDDDKADDKQGKNSEPAVAEVEKDTKNILKLEGNVGKKLGLGLSELKAKNNLIFKGDFYWINNFGSKNHTEFKGINLWGLLEEAGVSSGAKTVSIVAVDGYEMEFSLDQVKRQDYIDETDPDAKFPMIIAWEEDGAEYDPEDGPPFKLIIGQKEPGDVNKPQWVSKIDKIIVK